MENLINIIFKVTASQKETIDLRAIEHGFDNLSAYLKVVALKAESFRLHDVPPINETQDIELSFKVTTLQNMKLEDSLLASPFDELSQYLSYISIHAAISVAMEVRSTGSFDDMLKRISSNR